MFGPVQYEATSTMRYTLPVTSAKLAVVQVRHDSAAVRHEPTLLRMLHCVRLYSDLRFDGFGSDELARILMHVQSMSNDRVIESSSLRELNSRLASYLEQVSSWSELLNPTDFQQSMLFFFYL